MLRTPDTQPVISPSENTLENKQNGYVAAKPLAPWKQKIAKPLALGFGLAVIVFIITSLIPKQYDAVTTLYFPSGGSGSLLSSALGKGNPDSSSNVSLLTNVLSSPQVATSPQIAQALLDSDTLRANVAKDLNLQARWKESLPDVLDKLEKVSSFAIDKNGLLEVTIRDPDPVQAARMTKSFTDNLVVLANRTSDVISGQNTQFIRDRIYKTTLDLTKNEKLLARLQSANHSVPDMSSMMSAISSPPSSVGMTGGAGAALAQGMGGAGMAGGSASGGGSSSSLGLMGGNSASSSYLGLLATADKLQAELDGTNAAIAKAKNQAQTALSQGQNLSDDIPAALPERVRLHELEAQLENDRKTLGPDNPTFRQDSLEVQTARAQYNAAMQREQSALKMGIIPQLADLEAQRSSQQAVVNNFNAQVKKANKMLAKMPSYQMNLVNLQYRVVTDFEILKLQNLNLELAQDAQDRSMPTFTVVDPPTPPVKASFPKRGASTVFAAIAGILIGLLWQYWPMLRQQLHSGAE